MSIEINIDNDNISTEAIMAEIKEKVAEKRAAGAYDDPRIARAEKMNLNNIKDDEEFLKLYLDCDCHNLGCILCS